MDFKGENQQKHPLYNTPLEKWTVFFLVFMGALTVTYGVLFLIDFLPEEPKPQAEALAETVGNAREGIRDSGQTFETNPVDPDPSVIIFDSLDKQISVLNPSSRSVTDLDAALLRGVVRHPDSADFEDEGTIFLFGHSSYLPTVINKNFQAFNGIQHMKWGDTIRLQSSDHEYVYRVDRVYQVKATDAEIEIERGKPRLTLVTCNTFGSKEDRYILEATLVDRYTI